MRDTSYNAQRGRLSGSVRVYGGAWRLLEIHADGGFHQLRALRKKPAIYLPMKTGYAEVDQLGRASATSLASNSID